MDVYLVQHGAAKSEQEDPQRGLTDQGRSDVEKVARFLKPLNLALEAIEHSDKLRARQTAEILAQHLRAVRGTRQAGGLAPNDDIEPAFQRLCEAAGPLMLVGHLPHLSRLASRLLGLPPERPAVQFQMGGVVRLSRDESGHWAVRWMIVPELLAAAG